MIRRVGGCIRGGRDLPIRGKTSQGGTIDDYNASSGVAVGSRYAM